MSRVIRLWLIDLWGTYQRKLVTEGIGKGSAHNEKILAEVCSSVDQCSQLGQIMILYIYKEVLQGVTLSVCEMQSAK